MTFVEWDRINSTGIYITRSLQATSMDRVCHSESMGEPIKEFP